MENKGNRDVLESILDCKPVELPKPKPKTGRKYKKRKQQKNTMVIPEEVALTPEEWQQMMAERYVTEAREERTNKELDRLQRQYLWSNPACWR